jgi:periplasmic nitrate reductase NapD
MNISSVIVHAQPGAAEAVKARLARVDGVEVHAASAEGKIIVTIEATDDGCMADTFERISRLDSVMSASMVFHQVESDPDKEISNDTDAT